jgi:uncharacterized protein YjbI with pentapeptide repeats
MTTFTEQQLKDILTKHLKWLKNEDGGERANLRYANLRSANLSYANLRYADLSYADLRSANLSYADLRYADLRSADLRSADLRSADLSYADLRYANLSYADLRYANLSYADLRYADLRSANLIYFTYNRHTAYFTFDNKIMIGCENHEIKKWLKDFKKIGTANEYTKDEIMAYGVFIKLCSDLQKKHKRAEK